MSINLLQSDLPGGEAPEIRAPELSSYQPRPFRFRFGEFLLGEWRPRLGIMQLEGLETVSAPALAKFVVKNLPKDADGMVVLGASASEFPAGWQRSDGLIQYVARHDPKYIVDLTSDFESYLRTQFSAKARQNMVRSVRRVDASMPDQNAWSVATSRGDVLNFLEIAAAISKNTYQYQFLGVGLDDDESTRTHYAACADRGDARGYLLRIGGTPVAFAWCRTEGRHVIYDVIGYSPEHRGWSPGTVLLFHIIADLFSQGRFDHIDFGPGEAEYKAHFATQRLVAVDLRYLRDTPLNLLRVAVHWGLLNASIAFGHWLDRTGLKRNIKKFIRRVRGALRRG